MKDIFKKIHISSFFIIIIFLSFVSGLFRDIITLFLVIIVHEIGHVASSLMYSWNIKKIDIFLCGGFITYDEVIDKPFKEEFLIAISGFIFQTIFYLLIAILCRFNIIGENIYFLVKKYHYSVLFFNLLPIIPLDGAKVLTVFLSMRFSYKKVLIITKWVSFLSIIMIVMCFIFFNIKIEYSYLMILSFIVTKLIEMVKSIPYLFNRFLLERYFNPIKSKKYVCVKGECLDKIRRQKKHYFIINKHYYSERKVLSKRFD